MTAEIIYGVDFRAGKEEAPLCNAPDMSNRILEGLWEAVSIVHGVIEPARVRHFIADTAPSEYLAPSDDCA